METTSAGYNLPHFLNKVKILLPTETLVPFYIPKLKHWVLNGTFDKALSRCVRYSKQWKKRKRVKDRTLKKIDVQVRDMRHKITSRFVSSCYKRKIETIVIGDLK